MSTPIPDDRPTAAAKGDPPSNPIFPPRAGKTSRQSARFHNPAAGAIWPRLRKSGSIALAGVAVLVFFAWAYGAGRLPWMKSETAKSDAPENGDVGG